MKTRLIILAAMMFIGSLGMAQFTPNSPIRVTKLNHAGMMSWSNNLCPASPIYEVLRANSPTGAWQHYLFITNQLSTQITNSLGSSNGAVFYRIALAGDEPMTFNYSFTDDPNGFGCITASGQIRFGLLNASSNFWNISVTDICGLNGGGHPAGTGVLYGGLSRDALGNFIVRLKFNPGSEGYLLKGQLHRGTVNGQCSYDSISGDLYLSGFAGETPIGPFTATRIP